jgi:hypothetical protein
MKNPPGPKEHDQPDDHPLSAVFAKDHAATRTGIAVAVDEFPAFGTFAKNHSVTSLEMG